MFLAPMLLTKHEEPFNDERYVFEPKIDGHRMIISIQNGKVRLYTRHNNEVTRQYPELHNIPIDDSTDAVLDGEVACIASDTGSIDFEHVQERSKMHKAAAIRQGILLKPVHFYVFDILRYKGKDLRGLPLTERKAILSQVISGNAYVSHVLSIEGNGVSLFQVIKEKRLEGIVAKRKTSKYVGRKSSNWLKIINYSYADVQIAGYRKDEFGWLLQRENRPVGLIDLYVPAAHKKAFYRVSRSLVTGEDRNFIYLEPRITARVRFRNLYRSGMIRSPEFVDFVV